MDKYTDAFGNLKVPDDMADRILRAAEKDDANKPVEAKAPKKGKLTLLYRAAAGVAACLVLGLSLWLVKPQQAAPVSPEPGAPVVSAAVSAVDSSAPVGSAAPVETPAPSARVTAPSAGRQTAPPAATAPAAQTPAAGTPAAGDDAQVTNLYEDLPDAAALASRLGYTPKLPQTLPAGFSESGAALIGGRLAQVEYTDGAATVSYRTAKGADDVSGDYNSYSEQNTENSVTLKGDGGQISLAVWRDDASSYALSFSPGVTKQAALDWVGRVG